MWERKKRKNKNYLTIIKVYIKLSTKLIIRVMNQNEITYYLIVINDKSLYIRRIPHIHILDINIKCMLVMSE